MSLPVYGRYTQEELDRQYDQRSLVPNSAEITDRWIARGETARASLRCLLDVPYGEQGDERLDVFPAAEGAPVAVYLHGGAWTRRSKSDAGYIAPAFVAAGCSLVGVDFTLAPDASVDRMVEQCRRAVAWIFRNAAKEWGGDPSRLFVVGHSSGGHLAAMVLLTDWRADHDLPADTVSGVTALSGIYDLEPVRLSYRNGYLHLDEAAAARNSPCRHIRRMTTPLIVGFGDGELDEFQRQSRAFASAWREAGNDCTEILANGRNHFEVGDDLADPASAIFDAIARQIGLAR